MSGHLKSVPFLFSAAYSALNSELSWIFVLKSLWSIAKMEQFYFSTLTAFRFILLPPLLLLFVFFFKSIPLCSPFQLPTPSQSCSTLSTVSVPLSSSYLHHLSLPFPLSCFMHLNCAFMVHNHSFTCCIWALANPESQFTLRPEHLTETRTSATHTDLNCPGTLFF